jgi:predicted nucleic acid-binding protein
MKTDPARLGVADNNLVISAFIQPKGTGSAALDRMGLELELLASEATLAELRHTLVAAKVRSLARVWTSNGTLCPLREQRDDRPAGSNGKGVPRSQG